LKRIVSTDIGGTHVRFAVARLSSGRVVELGEPTVLRTHDYASFETAWHEFARRSEDPLPTELAVSVAGPIGDGDLVELTNNPWVLHRAQLKERLGLEHITFLNDFSAVAHAVGVLEDSAFQHLCGPEGDLPDCGVVTIVGPGTGLGVATLLRRGGGAYDVIPTEGGHIDFAPIDEIEDRILAELRPSFRRVSVERLVSGRGLLNIYEALSAIESQPVTIRDERELWAAALDGRDRLAALALDRFCLCLGAVAGNLALAQGACAVVIAGGVGKRLSQHLPRSGFQHRFTAKGRFERRMNEMPVKLVTHPEPGLLGAAVAAA
jgi:glucokinase